jgi:hypothetical protein
VAVEELLALKSADRIHQAAYQIFTCLPGIVEDHASRLRRQIAAVVRTPMSLLPRWAIPCRQSRRYASPAACRRCRSKDGGARKLSA